MSASPVQGRTAIVLGTAPLTTEAVGKRVDQLATHILKLFGLHYAESLSRYIVDPALLAKFGERVLQIRETIVAFYEGKFQEHLAQLASQTGVYAGIAPSILKDMTVNKLLLSGMPAEIGEFSILIRNTGLPYDKLQRWEQANISSLSVLESYLHIQRLPSEEDVGKIEATLYSQTALVWEGEAFSYFDLLLAYNEYSTGKGLIVIGRLISKGPIEEESRAHASKIPHEKLSPDLSFRDFLIELTLMAAQDALQAQFAPESIGTTFRPYCKIDEKHRRLFLLLATSPYTSHIREEALEPALKFVVQHVKGQKQLAGQFTSLPQEVPTGPQATKAALILGETIYSMSHIERFWNEARGTPKLNPIISVTPLPNPEPSTLSVEDYLAQLTVISLERHFAIKFSPRKRAELCRLFLSEQARLQTMYYISTPDFMSVDLSSELFINETLLPQLQRLQKSIHYQRALRTEVPELAEWVLDALPDHLVEPSTLPQVPETHFEMALDLQRVIDAPPEMKFRNFISCLIPQIPLQPTLDETFDGDYICFATWNRMRSWSSSSQLAHIPDVARVLATDEAIADRIIFGSHDENPTLLNLQKPPDARETFLLTEIQAFLRLKRCPNSTAIVDHLLRSQDRRSFRPLTIRNLIRSLLLFEDFLREVEIPEIERLPIFLAFTTRTNPQGFVQFARAVRRLAPLDIISWKQIFARFNIENFEPYIRLIGRVEAFLSHFSMQTPPGGAFWVKVLGLKNWPPDDVSFIRELQQLIDRVDDPVMLEIFYRHLAGLVTPLHLILLQKAPFSLSSEDSLQILSTQECHCPPGSSTTDDLVSLFYDQMTALINRFKLSPVEAGILLFKYFPTGLDTLRQEIAILLYIEQKSGARLSTKIVFHFLHYRLTLSAFRDVALKFERLLVSIESHRRKFLIPYDLMRQYGEILATASTIDSASMSPTAHHGQVALSGLVGLWIPASTLPLCAGPWADHITPEAIEGKAYRAGEEDRVERHPGEIVLLDPALPHGKGVRAQWSLPERRNQYPLFTVEVVNLNTGATAFAASRLSIPSGLILDDSAIMRCIAETDAPLLRELSQLTPEAISAREADFLLRVNNSLAPIHECIFRLELSDELRQAWVGLVFRNREMVSYLIQHRGDTDDVVERIRRCSTDLVCFVQKVVRIIGDESSQFSGGEPTSLDDCTRVYKNLGPVLKNYALPPGISQDDLFNAIFAFSKQMKIGYRNAIQFTSSPDGGARSIDRFLILSPSKRIYPARDGGLSLDDPIISLPSRSTRSIGTEYDDELRAMVEIVKGGEEQHQTFSISRGTLDFEFDPEGNTVTMTLKDGRPPLRSIGGAIYDMAGEADDDLGSVSSSTSAQRPDDDGEGSTASGLVIQRSSSFPYTEPSSTIRYGQLVADHQDLLLLLKRQLLIVFSQLPENS